MNPVNFRIDLCYFDNTPRHSQKTLTVSSSSSSSSFNFNENEKKESSVNFAVSNTKKLSKARPLSQTELWRNDVSSLKSKLVFRDLFNPSEISQVVGVYISVNSEDSLKCDIGISVHEYPNMKMLESQSFILPYKEPFVAGYSSFREVNIIVQCISKMKIDNKSLFMVNAPGILHTNGFGLACHLGSLLKSPVIGVTESISLIEGLTKEYVTKLAVDLQAGEVKLITSGKNEVGSIIKTTDKDPVIYVSTGNNWSLESSNEVVYTACADGDRMPACLKFAKELFENVEIVE